MQAGDITTVNTKLSQWIIAIRSSLAARGVPQHLFIASTEALARFSVKSSQSPVTTASGQVHGCYRLQNGSVHMIVTEHSWLLKSAYYTEINFEVTRNSIPRREIFSTNLKENTIE